MGLTKQLHELKRQLGRDIPQETLVKIGRFVQSLAQSGIEQTSCKAGDKIPAFALPNVIGQKVSSEDILARGPMVLSFYRGLW